MVPLPKRSQKKHHRTGPREKAAGGFKSAERDPGGAGMGAGVPGPPRLLGRGGGGEEGVGSHNQSKQFGRFSRLLGVLGLRSLFEKT